MRSRSDGSVRAEADEHRHDGLAGQADAPQQLVHHERHARHIAGVFQNRQEEKERHDDRQKAQNRADALKNAVDHKALHDGVQVIGRQRPIDHDG